MTISFACPGCQRIIRAPDSAAGRVGECRHCNQSVTIPVSDDCSTSDDSIPVASDPDGKSSQAGESANESRNSGIVAIERVNVGRRRQHGSAYEKAVMMHDCGLNKEAQLVLIDIVVSTESSEAEKAASLYLLGNIAFEENRVAVALKMWRQLVDEFPDSEEAVSVRDRLVELAEVVGQTIREHLDDVVAISYLSHADFWSRDKDSYFHIDSSWIHSLDAAIKWYDKILREFPGSTAAKIAYEGKLRTLLGWKEPGEYGEKYGVVEDHNKYMPILLSTFSAFVSDFPEASSLQAFRFQIAQAYWKRKDFKNTRVWLSEIISTSESSDSFYSDLAKRRIKNLEY